MCSCSLCKEQKSPDPPEDSDSSFFFCKPCSLIFCIKCVQLSHIQSNPSHLSQIYYICDDCESVEAPLFCKSCGQNLCSECDARIHNKGKRAQHSRETKVLPLPVLTIEKSYEVINNYIPRAIVLCSQNFFKDLEKNLRVLIESKGVKYLFLLILAKISFIIFFHMHHQTTYHLNFSFSLVFWKSSTMVSKLPKIW